jgi:putative transposase
MVCEQRQLVLCADERESMKRPPVQLLVHVVWSTAQRRAALLPSRDVMLADLLGEKTRSLGCSLLAVGIADDHVHAVVRLEAALSLADLVKHLKGASSYAFNEQRLLPAPLRWQVGYWAESVSPSALPQLVPYVRDQRWRHDDAHAAEEWQRSAL